MGRGYPARLLHTWAQGDGLLPPYPIGGGIHILFREYSLMMSNPSLSFPFWSILSWWLCQGWVCTGWKRTRSYFGTIPMILVLIGESWRRNISFAEWTRSCGKICASWTTPRSIRTWQCCRYWCLSVIDPHCCSSCNSITWMTLDWALQKQVMPTQCATQWRSCKSDVRESFYMYTDE